MGQVMTGTFGGAMIEYGTPSLDSGKEHKIIIPAREIWCDGNYFCRCTVYSRKALRLDQPQKKGFSPSTGARTDFLSFLS